MKILNTTPLDQGVTHILAQGPLEADWRDQVRNAWGAYDKRILNDEEWISEFEEGFYGPAWHSMIFSKESIVGHCALIPVEYVFGGQHIAGAGLEALYVVDSVRSSVLKYANGVRPYAHILTAETLKATRDLGLAFGLHTATKQATRLWQMAGSRAVEVDFTTFFLGLDWLENRKSRGKPMRWKDFGAHAAVKSYHTLLDVAGKIAGSKASARVVDQFGAEVDQLLLPNLTAQYDCIVPSSGYLNRRLWGKSYLKILLGNPIIGYLVIRTPNFYSSETAIVDYFVRLEKLNVRGALSIGGALRSVLSRSGISAVTINVPNVGRNVERWSRILRYLGFVRIGPPTTATLLYYTNNEALSVSQDWHITNLFQERS